MASAPLNRAVTGRSPEEEEALFGDYPKVCYRRNPLEFVVSEVRFPAILRIGTEPPAAFQTEIGKDFPLFSEVSQLAFAPPEIVKFLNAANVAPSGKVYEFSSADETWKLSISRESMALSCHNYTKWNEFRARFERPLEALAKIYSPPFFVRVGLRYRDVISRKGLGMAEIPWSELLTPDIAGEFHTRPSELIVAAWRQTVFKLQREDSQILLQHGLNQVHPKAEICYVFDADFSTLSRTEPSHAFDVLRFFNKYAWSIFRSCITDRLHNAMDPQPY